MRRKLGFGLFTALSLMAGTASADLIVGGHYLAPGRSLVGQVREPVVLVHVYNPGKEAIKAGDMRIGLDVAPTGGKSRTVEVKCPKDLNAAGIVTLPVALPKDVKALASNGWYRVSVTHAGAKTQSPRYPVTKPVVADPVKKVTVTELYTEAPALPDDPRAVVPPPDIPFEHEVAPNHPAVAPRAPAVAPRPAPSPAARPITRPVAVKPVPTPAHSSPNSGVAKTAVAPSAGKPATLTLSVPSKSGTARTSVAGGNGVAVATPKKDGKHDKSGSGKDAKDHAGKKSEKPLKPMKDAALSGEYESAPPLPGTDAVAATQEVKHDPTPKPRADKPAPVSIDAPARAVDETKTNHAKADASKNEGKKSDDKPVAPAKADEKKVDAKASAGPEFRTIRTIDEELVITVVRSGDTLRSIAEKYYKNGAKEKAIAEYNFIDNPSSIRVGEEIIVEVKPLGTSARSLAGDKDEPSAQGKGKKNKKSASTRPSDSVPAPTTSSAPAPTPAANGGEDVQYTVQRGDTPATIAKKFYGKFTKADRILNANPQLDPKKLMPGMIIVVPGAGAQS